MSKKLAKDMMDGKINLYEGKIILSTATLSQADAKKKIDQKIEELKRAIVQNIENTKLDFNASGMLTTTPLRQQIDKIAKTVDLTFITVKDGSIREDDIKKFNSAIDNYIKNIKKK